MVMSVGIASSVGNCKSVVVTRRAAHVDRQNTGGSEK